MTLVRWDPFRELEDMSDRLNRMFSRPASVAGKWQGDDDCGRLGTSRGRQ